MHTKTKAERMQISSKPQYKEVRFSSTSPKRLRPTKSFNSLTFLSWRMQHDYNSNPTLRQKSNQYIYIHCHRLEILAGSMASLGRGSGRACGIPNESQTQAKMPHISSHQMSHVANLITSHRAFYRLRNIIYHAQCRGVTGD